MRQHDPDIHHRRSIRLKEYNYAQPGLYFVTICVHKWQPLFGDVVNGEMRLNTCGKIANECWTAIATKFENTFLREFIVMPNHIHGIIEIVGARFIAPLRTAGLPARKIQCHIQIRRESFVGIKGAQALNAVKNNPHPHGTAIIMNM
ncbi:MAG: hypothetical protein FWG81_02645 [Betaproteobacteria bacterium]|nr:hypothetical protein [Betaproteobacteria bacterium]